MAHYRGALRWHGGKVHQAKWINGVLGPPRGSANKPTYTLYCEPFFGMGAVLLQRKRSYNEVVSDINGRVVNWWKIIQGRTEELIRAMELVPLSRQIFDEAVANLDQGNEMDRAVAFHTVVTQGMFAGDGNPWWTDLKHYHLDVGYGDKMRWLAHRVRKVAIENRCATKTLQRMARREHAVIYCDPPYWGVSDNEKYASKDKVELDELLLAQTGRCAISGFDNQWDHLGWERHERPRTVTSTSGSGRNHKRLEVMWCNGK